MYSLFVALGSAARSLATRDLQGIAGIDANSKASILRIGNEFLALISVPDGSNRALVYEEPETDVKLLVDGYLSLGDRLEDTNVGALSKLSTNIRRNGMPRALSKVVAGSFNLVFADANSETFVLANDETGSIPLYYSVVDGGLIASTSPLSIAATGLVSDDPDWVTLASWLYFGYAIGSRSVLKDIRVFPAGSFLTFQNGQSKIRPLGIELRERIPDLARPSTSKMAELVKNACKRAANVEGETGHMQSAGFDSRLLLAACQDGQNPPCFTYGRGDSTEVQIARRISEVRGSVNTHVWPDGDLVADSLDRMFRLNGFMAYADRYLVSKRIHEDGYTNVLDGFWGGVLLGGAYYEIDRGFSTLVRLSRYATIFRDLSVSKIGLPRISRTLAEKVSEVRDLKTEYPFLSTEFVHEIERYRPNLLEDIETECESLTPVNDSLALLFRNFFMRNRGLHAIAQQGVVGRAFVRPMYVFSNDRDVFNACMRLTPACTAYHKFYIRLFKEQFPEYAEVKYGVSMIALKNSALAHGLYTFLARGEAAVFGRGNRMLKLSIKPNNWSHWLKNSNKLREKLVADLQGSNIANTKLLGEFVADLQGGEREGSGKLFHIASVAKFLS